MISIAISCPSESVIRWATYCWTSLLNTFVSLMLSLCTIYSSKFVRACLYLTTKGSVISAKFSIKYPKCWDIKPRRLKKSLIKCLNLKRIGKISYFVPGNYCFSWRVWLSNFVIFCHASLIWNSCWKSSRFWVTTCITKQKTKERLELLNNFAKKAQFKFYSSFWRKSDKSLIQNS